MVIPPAQGCPTEREAGRHFPRLTPLLCAIAALVGFSRVYLGAHYPGDVLSGATSGVVFAAVYYRLIEEFSEELTEVLDATPRE